MNKKPSFDHEKEFWDKNLKVFGIDEVGRGSFAGPLVGAAVSFENYKKFEWLKDINDSKLLSHKQRVHLSRKIKNNTKYFIETINLTTIDKIGIGKSNALLFKRLIKKISKEYKGIYFLLDGRQNLENRNSKFIIKGDSISISIAAASIIAKVYRDGLMKDLDNYYKGYDFAKNKGYGTKFHREAIKKLGLSGFHRKSFKLGKFMR
jgi:ribonuclease HII